MRRAWGWAFPIVGLRCSEVRGWNKTGQTADSVWFGWQRHDEAEGYEVRVIDELAGTDTVYRIGDPEETRFALHTLDTGAVNSLQVRKLCHYTTDTANGGYDTIVRSPWSEPLVVYGPAPYTPNPDDTTAIAVVDGIDFAMQPNPAHGSVQLRLDGTDGHCHIGVYDMAGREVLTAKAEGTQEVRLDISHLTAGAYMVRLTAPQGTALRRLLVK